jgi:hypothetical protein
MHNVRTSRGRDGGDTQPATTEDYHAYHDPDSAAKLSTTVIHALADVMGTDVTDTGFALDDSVDVDALDRIFAPAEDGTPRSPGHVAFAVEGYRVTVYDSGQIVITPPAMRSR